MTIMEWVGAQTSGPGLKTPDLKDCFTPALSPTLQFAMTIMEWLGSQTSVLRLRTYDYRL